MLAPAPVTNEDLMSARPSHVPPHAWVGHWLTIPEFARLTGRSVSGVYTILERGTLAEFGIATYRVRSGRLHSGRTFIRNPYF